MHFLSILVTKGVSGISENLGLSFAKLAESRGMIVQAASVLQASLIGSFKISSNVSALFSNTRKIFLSLKIPPLIANITC